MPGERAFGTHWLGGSVDSRVSLDVVTKIPSLCWESTPGFPPLCQSLYCQICCAS